MEIVEMNPRRAFKVKDKKALPAFHFIEQDNMLFVELYTFIGGS